MMNLIVALFIWIEGATAGALLRVRPHVVATPSVEVKLAQIVDAQDLSEEAQLQLQTIALSVAPAAGERQELTEATISGALRPVIQLERERKGNRIQVVIPKVVVIDTVQREFDEDSVKSELLQVWQPLCSECKLEIEGLSLPHIKSFRDWTMKVKAEMPRGSFSVPMHVVRSDGSSLSAWISGRVLVKKKVPVTKRMMSMGERIQEKDVALEYRDTTFAYDGIPSQEEFVGKRMKQTLRSGEILWRGMIEKEKAIRRGDTVTVRSGSGQWEVSMNLISQQDAFLGDIVNLRNPKTNTAMVGEVTGQGEVELR